MAFALLGSPKPQFFDNSGNPLVLGTLNVYEPTDDTEKSVYPTADDADAQTNAHSNPLVLNSRGEPATGLFGRNGEDYKLVLKDSTGSTVWTVDDVSQGNLALIKYTPGFTGAVERTMQSRLDDWVSVKDFGATGDGSTDDLIAIQAAIDTNALVYFPEGTYLVSDSILLNTNNILFGNGLLKITTNNWILDGQNITDVSVDGLRFLGNSTGTSQHAINFYGVKRFVIRGNIIKDMGHNGIRVAYSFDDDVTTTDGTITGNVVTGCGNAGIFAKKQVLRVAVTGNTFDSCDLGIFIDDGSAADPSGPVACRFWTVVGNVITNTVDNHGIGVVGSADIVISGNVIDNINGTNFGIDVRDGAGSPNIPCERITINGNQISNTGSHGIQVEGASGAVCEHIKISDNLIRGWGVEGTGTNRAVVFVGYVDNSTIKGNDLIAETSAGTLRGLDVGANCNNNSVKYNDLDKNGQTVTSINNGGTSTRISGNEFDNIETQTGSGALDLATGMTYIASTGVIAVTLADGSEGQIKTIIMTADGGTATLTPATLGSGTTITFDDVGDSAELLFTNSAWYFMSGTATLA